MASQVNTQLRGRIGDLDFFEPNGDFFARPHQRYSRQTPATRVQASVFGRASLIASSLCDYLKPWWAPYANNNAWNRLNRAIASWIRSNGISENSLQNNLPYISGFQFNTLTSVGERLRFALQVNRTAKGTLVLEIPVIHPAQNIAAPGHTKTVCPKILALSCTTNNTTITRHFTT